MHKLLNQVWREEDGQDLIEYTLLMTFIVIATAAVIGSGQSVLVGIWGSGNSTVAAASTTAAS
jgi:Flp pilus assembly pilin Flp